RVERRIRVPPVLRLPRQIDAPRDPLHRLLDILPLELRAQHLVARRDIGPGGAQARLVELALQRDADLLDVRAVGRRQQRVEESAWGGVSGGPASIRGGGAGGAAAAARAPGGARSRGAAPAASPAIVW